MPKRTDISSILVIGAGLLSVGCASPALVQTQTLTRTAHDHAIFLLSGDPQKLERFDSEVGSNWKGGVLLAKDQEAGVYSYWAFSERTAPQSRSFIMRATFSGLTLNFREYREAGAFPEYRSALDEIALNCGFTIDPFFISPFEAITVNAVEETDTEKFGCALRGVHENDTLSKLSFGFLGNEKYASDESE